MDYGYYAGLFADWLAEQGDSQGAVKCLKNLHKALAGSKAGGHRVSAGVLDAISAKTRELGKG